MKQILKSYKSLKGYLHRFTVAKVGPVHIRIHHILCADKTPFLHSHPDHYFSLVISGGYTELTQGKVIVRNAGSLCFRPASQTHQIVSVLPNTKTIFIAIRAKHATWKLEEGGITPQDWVDHHAGVYKRYLYGREVFSKFDRFWHKACDSIQCAIIEKTPSIDQTTQGELVYSGLAHKN